MTTAIIDNETRYAIPDYDLDFFIAIANKMGWKKVKSSFAKKESWVDQLPANGKIPVLPTKSLPTYTMPGQLMQKYHYEKIFSCAVVISHRR